VNAPDASRELDWILSLVAARRNIDFRDYRRDTVLQRVLARASALGFSDLRAYRRVLSEAATEVERLIEALVVPVTGFFREPALFGELERLVLPRLFERTLALRAWAIGVATGEEAYSLAMILADAARTEGRDASVLATDLDERSLREASRALYPRDAALAVPESLRNRYLRAEGDFVRPVASIRGRVTLAQHDLVGPRIAPVEAVMASFELVMCRNVLLYFEGPLREKAAARLAGIVVPGGALVLGEAEALPASAATRFMPWPGSRAGILRRRP
jgi:chemotaxis methyl-accepting protein methylase